MTILQRDQSRLQRPQHGNRTADDQRGPQNEMYPDRRREFYLDQSREPDDDQAKEQNDENGWAVSGILCGEIKAADLASAAYIQQPSV